MIRNVVSCLFFSLLVLAPRQASAQPPRLAVMPPNGADISARILEDARTFLVQSLARSFPVTVVAGAPTAAPPDAVAASIAAKAQGADIAVVLTASRAGTAVTMFVTGLSVLDGRVVYSAQETTHGGPSALPSVVEALANKVRQQAGVFGQVSVQAPAADCKPLPDGSPRVTVRPGIRVGGVVPIKKAGDTSAVLPGAAIFALVDGVSYLVDVHVEFAETDGAHMRGFGLGAYLPFSDESSAAYLGVNLDWLAVKLGGQGASGLAAGPAAGFMWRRYHPVRLRLEVGYFYSLFQEKSVDRLIPGSGGGHNTHGLRASIGVSF